jgi:mersacidin/lichenicidin family type 2 lantibiotic
MVDTIRAWKDPAYRRTLSEAQLAALPVSPAGQIELSDTELDAIHGGLPRRSDLTSMLRTCTAGSDSCCC